MFSFHEAVALLWLKSLFTLFELLVGFFPEGLPSLFVVCCCCWVFPEDLPSLFVVCCCCCWVFPEGLPLLFVVLLLLIDFA
jgi:hypothetical protein